jgi:PPP family 3-phenylpropionic acid transporter
MAHVVAGDWGRYGRVRLWGSAGFLVTVFVAGAWFERFGMHHFPGWAVATLLGVAACTFWLPKVHDRPTQGERSHAPIWPVLRQPVVVWFFVSLFFHVMAHMAIYAYFSLFLDDRGYSKTVIGALWALSVLAEIAWFFWQGKFIGRRPMSCWLLVCAWATVIRMALTGGLADWWPALVIGQLLHAFTFAGHHTACVAMVTRHFSGSLRARGQALFTSVGYGLGGVVGVLAGGSLVQAMGYEGLFAAATLLALAATASTWRLRRIERRLESKGHLADGTGRSA